MYIYVAHEYNGNAEVLERAKKITHDLQIFDRENTYLCPLTAYSHIGYDEYTNEEWVEMHKDLICICDKVLVASEIGESIKQELDFADKIHMEVDYLEI